MIVMKEYGQEAGHKMFLIIVASEEDRSFVLCLVMFVGPKRAPD